MGKKGSLCCFCNSLRYKDYGTFAMPDHQNKMGGKVSLRWLAAAAERGVREVSSATRV